MARFSDRLRFLRQKAGLSQQDFAKMLGSVSKSSINMYERGEREPSIETLEAIADFFNVDLDYLLGKTDMPNKSPLSVDQLELLNDFFFSRMDILSRSFAAWRDYLITISSALGTGIDLSSDDSTAADNFFEISGKIAKASEVINKQLKSITPEERVKFEEQTRELRKIYKQQIEEYSRQIEELDSDFDRKAIEFEEVFSKNTLKSDEDK